MDGIQPNASIPSGTAIVWVHGRVFGWFQPEGLRLESARQAKPKNSNSMPFFRFAPFCEPALNKVTRMLNLSLSRLSSLKSLVLVPLVSLLAFFFFSCIFPCWSYSALYTLCLVLSVWSGLFWSVLVLVSSDCCACACAWTLRHLSYFGLVACKVFVCYSVVNFYFLVFFVSRIML